MDGGFDKIDKLLVYFDNCNNDLENNKLRVDEFFKHLKSKSSKLNCFFINGSSFIGVGSNYENTSVNPNSVFDIAMVLPTPFTTKYFQVTKEEAGLFRLKCNTSIVSMPKAYITKSRYLHTDVLKEAIFSELTLSMQTMNFQGYTVEYERLKSSFGVTLKKDADVIKIVISPQIEAKVNNIPGWNGSNLPLIIQDYIKKTDRHILFNLSCPIQHKTSDCSHLIVQPYFNLLEKEAMLKSDVVGYSVCISNVLSKHNNWTSKGLRSYHIKHVALQLYDEIELVQRYPWLGFSLIMDKLTIMLQNGKIGSLFIKDHNIICADQKKCQALAKEIKKIYSSTTPASILRFLEPLEKVEKNNNKPTSSPEIPSSTHCISKPLEKVEEKNIKPTSSLEIPSSSHCISKSLEKVEKKNITPTYSLEIPSSTHCISKPLEKVEKKNIKPTSSLEILSSTHCILEPLEKVEKKNSKPTSSLEIPSSVHCISKPLEKVEKKNIKPISSLEIPCSAHCISKPLEKVEKKNIISNSSSETRSSTQHIMKVPLFMEGAAFNWFEMVDALSFVHKIADEEAKFYHAFAALPKEIVTKLTLTTITEHKFSLLKEAVIKICDTNKIEKFREMVSSLEEKEKPSIFLKEIQLIAANLGVNEDCVRSKFLESFTPSIAHILHSQKELSLLMLGKLGDDLITLLKSKDSSKVVKLITPIELNQHSVICSNHIYFGQKAVTCNIHCQWPNKNGLLISSCTSSQSTFPTSESKM